MNLQVRLTELLKANQSALRVISQLQTQLAEATVTLHAAREMNKSLVDENRQLMEGIISTKIIKDLKTKLEKLEVVRAAAEILFETRPAGWSTEGVNELREAIAAKELKCLRSRG